MNIITQNNMEYKLQDNGEAAILRYTGASHSLILPEKVRDHTVTAIAAGAFRDCVTLYSVVIPASVTSIGENAFRNCGTEQTVDEDLAQAYSARCRRDLEAMFGYGYEYYESRMMGGESPVRQGLTLTVKRGGYAEDYCRKHGITYNYG